MDKRVILAVAGAGKTYYICHAINPKKRNLILAYTHENINNILRELKDAHGAIPSLTTVMTFDSFVYRCLICPYEPTIGDFFGLRDFKGNRVTTREPEHQILNINGRNIPNPQYVKQEKIEHYIAANNDYYCSRMSKLVTYVKKGKESLIRRAAQRLNLFYDQILIDEFQDFREYDYNLIVAISKYLNNVLLVGDYYQHSVSANNNSGKPFMKHKTEITYLEFVKKLEKLKFDVDETTLKKSRRCSENICKFVREKLDINIESTGTNNGQVIWVDKDEIDSILKNKSITKLVYMGANRYTFEPLNWSYSKGDTVCTACVILTDNLENMDTEKFSITDISVVTRNKLYVALTRSKGDLFLVKASDFKNIKEAYLK